MSGTVKRLNGPKGHGNINSRTVEQRMDKIKERGGKN